ncbi:hypothetical protein CLU83_0900 [Flavobacterium sp. 1]|uniref:hypothetical protein n=1 Tax=Flavobacterium sp. 1 TaxID=2035200 RepID=UPI000C2356F1|nr:hypothetical protein [Flavobacterium sp. 1]PJJ07704.1 hypothetical protein CLU83_0900 [Flavobacterium sp. 1]
MDTGCKSALSGKSIYSYVFNLTEIASVKPVRMSITFYNKSGTPSIIYHYFNEGSNSEQSETVTKASIDNISNNLALEIAGDLKYAWQFVL